MQRYVGRQYNTHGAWSVTKAALIKGLLHYPTCSAQLREWTWCEVERMHDLPQMTHFGVVESEQLYANSQHAVFVYLTFLIDEIVQLDNIQLYNLKNPISSIRIRCV